MVANMVFGFIPIIGSFVSLLATPFMLIFSVHFYQALKKVTVVAEVRTESHRLTTTLIVVGVIAVILSVWLVIHFSSL